MFATGFTLAVCLAAGMALLRRAGAKLARGEELFLAFVLGSAVVSAGVFALTAAHLAYRGVFLAAGAAVIAAGAWMGRSEKPAEKCEPLPRFWAAVFGVVYGAFALLYLGYAMLPEVSPDGAAYHVALAARYLREHHFPRITTNWWAHFPEGIEMLFLFAFAFGKHTAAAMVHFLYTLAAPLGMLWYGRRIGRSAAGAVGGLLFFLSPIVGKTGTSAYIDLGEACILLALFYLLEIWGEQQNRRLLPLIGALAGFAYAAKYTGILAVPYAMAYVALGLWRRESWLRPAALVGLCALAMMAPWIKNAVVVGNPFAPVANRYFPNPYISVGLEQDWRQVISALGGVQRWEIPLEATLRGGRLEGVLGPVFLLAPLALLALREAAGRRLLAAALLFAAPYHSAIATRYLIPCLPFVALAMGLALTRWRALAATVVLAHAVLSWPAVVSRYAAPGSWRLGSSSWEAALRIEPEGDFLRREMDHYGMGLLIEKIVPPGEKMLSFQAIQQAYHTREVMVNWHSSLGRRLGDALATPVSGVLRPTWRHQFEFGERVTRRLRVVETQQSATERWSVSELRVFRGGAKLARAPEWRLRASHNPWEVQLAFDNNPVSRWTSGEPYRPGMFLEVDFGRTEPIDGVVVECSHNQLGVRMQVEVENREGQWETVANQARLRDAPAPARLRRIAVETLKMNGVHWIVMHDLDSGARDLQKRQAQWGVTLAAADGPYKLWRLD